MICDKVAWNSNLASPFIVLARKWRESLVMLKFSPHSQLACPICIVTPNLEESDEVVYTLRRQHTSTHFQPLEKGTGRIAELASTQLRLSIRICMPRRKFQVISQRKISRLERDTLRRCASANGCAPVAQHLLLVVFGQEWTHVEQLARLIMAGCLDLVNTESDTDKILDIDDIDIDVK